MPQIFCSTCEREMAVTILPTGEARVEVKGLDPVKPCCQAAGTENHKRAGIITNGA